MCVVEDLESDYFGKLEPKFSVIRNLNDQVLFINQESQPVFEDMPDSDCSGIFLYTFVNMEMTSYFVPFHLTDYIFCDRPNAYMKSHGSSNFTYKKLYRVSIIFSWAEKLIQ